MLLTNTTAQNRSVKKLQAKDLINIGIFTALYFIVFFATGMIGYVPVLMLAIPLLCPLVSGIPFMLFLTRVNKFGMVSIMGIVLSLLMLFTGHPWPVVPIGVFLAFGADLILSSGNYRSWGHIRLGYIVFSEWLLGLMMPLFFMKESYFASIRDGYGNTYADTLMAITPTWVFFVMIAMAAIGALLGASLGRSVLRRHFQKAGIA
jgi:energy-coupling factor transport system substrate-specific component